MPSTYPGALDAFPTTRTDATVTATTHPAEHNDVNDALNKIEAELGVNPSGSFASVGSRLGSRVDVRKSADQTFNSTITLADVTDMTFPIVAGADYSFVFYVAWTSAAVANGIRLAVACPALAAGGYISYLVQIPIAADGTAATFHGSGTASDDAVIATAALTANTVYIATIHGILSNASAAGNLTLRAANEVSTANGNVIKRGSYGNLYTN